jgi:DNA-binding XRE family transcriptional regulator
MEVQLTPRASRYAPRFPNTIREYRLKAGLSQKKLAQILGRGRNAISSWERGLTKPDVTLGVRMAKTLATLVESLYLDFYTTKPKDGDQPNAAST